MGVDEIPTKAIMDDTELITSRKASWSLSGNFHVVVVRLRTDSKTAVVLSKGTL